MAHSLQSLPSAQRSGLQAPNPGSVAAACAGGSYPLVTVENTNMNSGTINWGRSVPEGLDDIVSKKWNQDVVIRGRKDLTGKKLFLIAID